MQVIQIISFILFLIGICIKLDITPKNYIMDINEKYKNAKGQYKENLKERINNSKISKKEHYIERLINETKEIMANNGTIQYFNKVIFVSIILCIAGMILSLLLNNIFILPILTVLFGLIPFYYVRLQSLLYKRKIKKELETALSNITSTYMKYNTTFLEAVKENIDGIRYPLKATFKRFVLTTEHINSNIKENIEQLKKAINDETYREWIDGIIASEDNYDLKATLPNIINKFSDMRIINQELSTKMYIPLKDYILMVVITVFSIPLFMLFNTDMVVNYMSSMAGKIEITIVLIVIIICTIRVLQELKPSEYRS